MGWSRDESNAMPPATASGSYQRIACSCAVLCAPAVPATRIQPNPSANAAAPRPDTRSLVEGELIADAGSPRVHQEGGCPEAEDSPLAAGKLGRRDAQRRPPDDIGDPVLLLVD